MAEMVNGNGKSVWILTNAEDQALRYVLYTLHAVVLLDKLPPNIVETLKELQIGL